MEPKNINSLGNMSAALDKSWFWVKFVVSTSWAGINHMIRVWWWTSLAIMCCLLIVVGITDVTIVNARRSAYYCILGVIIIIIRVIGLFIIISTFIAFVVRKNNVVCVFVCAVYTVGCNKILNSLKGMYPSSMKRRSPQHFLGKYLLQDN